MKRAFIVVAFLVVTTGCGSTRTVPRPVRFADDVFTVRPDGTGLRDLTRSPSVSERLLSVSPDGRRLAFFRSGRLIVRDRGRERSLGKIRLGSPWEAAPAWSPDGQTLAVTDGVGCSEHHCSRTDLWTVAAATGKRRAMAHSAVNPAWLPDGRVSFAGDFKRFWLNSSETGFETAPTRWFFGGRRLVAGEEGGIAVPAQRGHLVAYRALAPPWPRQGLVVMNQDSKRRRFLDAGARSALVWSHDGRWLAYLCDHSLPPRGEVLPALCVRNMAGRGLRVFAGVEEGPIAWSQDDRSVAWLECAGRPGATCANEIFVGNVATGHRRRVTHNAPGAARIDSLGWTADGRTVFDGTGIRY